MSAKVVIELMALVAPALIGFVFFRATIIPADRQAPATTVAV